MYNYGYPMRLNNWSSIVVSTIYVHIYMYLVLYIILVPFIYTYIRLRIDVADSLKSNIPNCIAFSILLKQQYRERINREKMKLRESNIERSIKEQIKAIESNIRGAI